MRTRWILMSLAVLIAVITGRSSRAQCPAEWLPGDGVPGVNGWVSAMVMWDPDGIGPRPPVLVVGGQFTVAGDAAANNIAIYDPVTQFWSALGSGISGGSTNGRYPGVFALAVLPNGDLVAGGFFSTAGGVSASCIARWNGQTWSAIGAGVRNGIHYGLGVFALAALPNGDLVAAGEFLSAGTVSANSIARWDGRAWSALGEGVGGGAYQRVNALAVLPNGELAVGGWFSSAGGFAADYIARWNGTSWSTFGAGLLRQGDGTLRGVFALTVLPNGDLVAGGRFTTAGSNPAYSIARWNGSTWSGVSFGSIEFVWSLAVLPNGDLVAGGSFTGINGLVLYRIARWNGTSWAALGSGVDRRNINTPNGISTHALAVLPDGHLVAGGTFSTAGGVGASAISRWDGTSWSSLGSGANASINALTVLRNGDVVAGGTFSSIGRVTANYIASWNGTSWSALGAGIEGNGASVEALVVLPNGDLIAGGSFSFAGGISANNLARWDGSTWTALGSGVNNGVSALAVLSNGDVVAGGGFTTAGGIVVHQVARWNGTSWAAMGTGFGGMYPNFTSVEAFAVLPSGDLVAGGYLSSNDGATFENIYRWNGTSWTSLGLTSFGGVHALAVLHNGVLVAGGSFSMNGVPVNLAHWNGTTWGPMVSGFNSRVFDLAVLSDGSLLAGGEFTSIGGATMNRIARWDGTSWDALGTGISGEDSRGNYPAVRVHALATLRNNEVASGGWFGTAGGHVSACFARYTFGSPCRADVDCNGGVTTEDLFYYVSLYADGLAEADVDDGTSTGTSDGGVTIDDLLYYLFRFVAGC